jgi:hypothetical protein
MRIKKKEYSCKITLNISREIDCKCELSMWQEVKHLKLNLLQVIYTNSPVTVAERSKACTVFARSEAGIVGSNPSQSMDVWCVCEFFCVCVVMCSGRGFATAWSPVQGALPSVNDQEIEKSALCSKKWEQRGRKNIYTNSVRTSQKTHYVSATKTNRLMLFEETVAVYCENHKEHTDCG